MKAKILKAGYGLVVGQEVEVVKRDRLLAQVETDCGPVWLGATEFEPVFDEARYLVSWIGDWGWPESQAFSEREEAFKYMERIMARCQNHDPKPTIQAVNPIEMHKGIGEVLADMQKRAHNLVVGSKRDFRSHQVARELEEWIGKLAKWLTLT